MFSISITEYGHYHVVWFIRDDRQFIQPYAWNIAIRQWAEWVETFKLKGNAFRCWGGEHYSLENKMVFTEIKDALMIKLAFDSRMFE